MKNDLSEEEKQMVTEQIYLIKDLDEDALYTALGEFDRPKDIIEHLDKSISIQPYHPPTTGLFYIDIRRKQFELGIKKFNKLKSRIYKIICCDMDVKETLENMNTGETLTLASTIAGAVGLIVPVTGVLAIVSVLIAKKGIPKYCNEAIKEYGHCS